MIEFNAETTSSIESSVNNELSSKEVAMIKGIMEKYKVKVVDIVKARSAYKIITTQGLICLKRMHHGKYKAANGSRLVEELRNNNFDFTAKYIKTTDGNLYVKSNKLVFYATEWIDGEECDLSSMEEVIACTKLLSKFHQATSKIDTERLKIRNNLKNWPKVFNDNLRELEKYKKTIERKKIKNEFDSLYYNHIDGFYNRGLIALKYLNNTEYYKLSKEANEKKTICHDSFYYQNIIKKNDNYYIIDLDSIIIDLHVNDLGKFIRRLMFKKEFQWNFEKAREIIEAYMTINPLTKNELEVMLALIIFPHNFWKLGKKRYIKYKNWTEAKYMHKLNKLIDSDELQQNFLINYLDFLNSID